MAVYWGVGFVSLFSLPQLLVLVLCSFLILLDLVLFKHRSIPTVDDIATLRGKKEYSSLSDKEKEYLDTYMWHLMPLCNKPLRQIWRRAKNKTSLIAPASFHKRFNESDDAFMLLVLKRYGPAWNKKIEAVKAAAVQLKADAAAQTANDQVIGDTPESEETWQRLAIKNRKKAKGPLKGVGNLESEKDRYNQYGAMSLPWLVDGNFDKLLEGSQRWHLDIKDTEQVPAVADDPAKKGQKKQKTLVRSFLPAIPQK